MGFGIYFSSRNLVEVRRRGLRAQERVDVRQFRILDDLLGERRHLVGGMPHVLHELRVGDRTRRKAGARASSLRLVAVALVAAEAHEQFSPVRGVPLRHIRLLLSLWSGCRLLTAPARKRTRQTAANNADARMK